MDVVTIEQISEERLKERYGAGIYFDDPEDPTALAEVFSPSDYDFENCPTRLDPTGPYHKRDVVAAIIFARGVLAEIAMLLGRRRNKVRDYIFANSEIHEIFLEVRDAAVDRVEALVFQQALDGDGAQQRFVLTTLGKERGFGNELKHTAGGALEELFAHVAEHGKRLGPQGD